MRKTGVFPTQNSQAAFLCEAGIHVLNEGNRIEFLLA
jgi:hypothetical protein